MSDQETVKGTVSVRRVATGSKSEQVTAVLDTGERSWLLRRTGGPGFGVDDDLAALEGKTVTATGYKGSGVFLATDIAPSD
jgi:hypothetical protein